METKYMQNTTYDCGICAIKNLLFLSNINFSKIHYSIGKSGISMSQICIILKQYFKEINAVSFDINELKKVTQFIPYITLIKNKNTFHYVVIYKKDDNYVYIMDSLYKQTYKMKYDDFKKIDCEKSIVCYK